MSVFYIMVPASILLALVFLGGFLWSVRNGQYEDTYTPSVRILFEDGTSTQKGRKNSAPIPEKTEAAPSEEPFIDNS